ncbi:hypothetical protein NPIL_147391 [Nephila pilipes]|uniref:Uncharacterized protein n=1 Tax=Nephila pilipes TaxID=299642 RepID=A0A8X6TWV7_NEPPI|nr:hypothetical protein NPIL_343891 [Nephila pilipes]GFT65184.1 hypothetical protein NPIL_147391 [Nephila pilipes]
MTYKNASRDWGIHWVWSPSFDSFPLPTTKKLTKTREENLATHIKVTNRLNLLGVFGKTYLKAITYDARNCPTVDLYPASIPSRAKQYSSRESITEVLEAPNDYS